MKHFTGLILLVNLLTPLSNFAQNNAQNMDNKKKHSVEVIRYTIQQDKHSSFEQAYTDAAKYLQQSPYCLGYQLIHGNEEPDHYILIIHWTSKEDHLNGFRKSAAFMPFYNLVKPFFANIEEMKHYEATALEWKKE
jgi:quinol monooxygenase YgiN